MTPPTWLYWPAAAAAWAPTDLTGLQCWLDASDSSTITESGGSISLWEDKTTNGNDADDAVNASNVKITTKRPTIATAEQNGLDAVAFSGSQWFDHNTAKGMLKNRSCALMGVVMKHGSIGSFQFAWVNGNATGINRMALGLTDTSDFRLLSRREDADTTTASVVSSGDTNWHVFVGLLDWTNGNLEFFIDGTSVGTSSYQSSGKTENTDLNTTATTRTAIGSLDRDGGGNNLANGSRIGEMICGALSSGSYATSDREKLEGYLAWKWGLEANLPNGHPYENAAP